MYWCYGETTFLLTDWQGSKCTGLIILQPLYKKKRATLPTLHASRVTSTGTPCSQNFLSNSQSRIDYNGLLVWVRGGKEQHYALSHTAAMLRVAHFHLRTRAPVSQWIQEVALGYVHTVSLLGYLVTKWWRIASTELWQTLLSPLTADTDGAVCCNGRRVGRAASRTLAVSRFVLGSALIVKRGNHLV